MIGEGSAPETPGCPTPLTPRPRAYADSKTLTEEKRERLLSQIEGDPGMGYIADVLDASFIAARMLSREKTSLNVLASDSTCSLIETALARGVNLTEVYIDTVGDPGRYQELLSRRFPGIAFTVCPKADALFPVVSAASIAAKVIRDRLLRDFQPPEAGLAMGRDFGCGYPGDAVTKAWLDAHVDRVFGFPSLVRRAPGRSAGRGLLAWASSLQLHWAAGLARDSRRAQGDPPFSPPCRRRCCSRRCGSAGLRATPSSTRARCRSSGSERRRAGSSS